MNAVGIDVSKAVSYTHLENPVNNSDICFFSRDKTSDLCHQYDQGSLSHVGRLTCHVRTCDNAVSYTHLDVYKRQVFCKLQLAMFRFTEFPICKKRNLSFCTYACPCLKRRTFTLQGKIGRAHV